MAKITPDDRVLKRGSLPFFWLGDTCWSAFTNMTDAEWQDYIIKRAAQGFNVVQVNALPQWDRCGSTLGLYPFPTQDGLHFNYDGTLNKAYFARAGRMAALAAHYGITLAVAVQWCNYVPGTWAAAKHPENILPAAMVEPVVKKICETFSAYDPVFLISGDADFETEQALQRYLWVTRLVQKSAPDAPLAYHLKGWSDALPQELAENAALYLYQSGHNPAYQYTARTLAESFRAQLPQKPVLNSEPCYEQMGYSRLAYGRHRREDCRRILWTSLLSGACAGITYGAHGVWNWYKLGMPENPVSGEGFLQAPLCTDALGLPGAEDFAFARQLCEGWGRWDFTPCPEVLLAYREEIPAARSGVRTVLYLPTAAPLPLADTLSVQKIYFIDLETRKALPAHCLYKAGALHLEQAPCYRDALLIIEGESPC